MCTTSIAMQPASANASACIGDGPRLRRASPPLLHRPTRAEMSRAPNEALMTVGGSDDCLFRHQQILLPLYARRLLRGS